MDTQDLGSLLDRIRVIRHPCDLDLLIFFHRHPCALLTSERLAACLGYDHARVAKSLDALLETGFLTQSGRTSRAARLYVLELHGLPGGLLSSLLITAATREGRRGVMRLLESGSDPAPSAGLRHHASMADSRVA